MIIYALLGFMLLILPIILTVLNILDLLKINFKDNRFGRFMKNKKLHTDIIVIYGALLYGLMIWFVTDEMPGWEKAVYYLPAEEIPQHQPFSEQHIIALALFLLAGVVSLVMLNRRKIQPPLAAALQTGGVYLGGIILVICSVQLAAHPWMTGVDYLTEFPISPYMFLYAANYILCAVNVITENVRLWTAHIRENGIEAQSPLMCRLWDILGTAGGWVWFPLLCVIPVTGVLVIICILFGQGADGIIKAFTETSDWTFSQMVSPPPERYSGHYLCTVAVNGHERVVKPTRMGIRHGERIVVNRQLCVANAFEQLIEDKAPRFHRGVRYVYDRYGYPVSKHITTKARADVVYILMKPLEWLFVIALYLFDTDPESRIAIQYTGRHRRDFMVKKG